MFRKRWLALAGCFFVILNAFAQDSVAPTLHIDIPTTLEKRTWSSSSDTRSLTETCPLHLETILHDESYNANRPVSAGNPYKELLNGLFNGKFMIL